MALLFVDLDNTLVDRAASMERWAEAYVTERTGAADPALVAEVIRADGDGLRPKPEVATDLARLFDLTSDDQEAVIAALRAGVLEHLRPDPEIVPALTRAREAGYTPFVVTNGTVAQQQNKMRLMDLEQHVAGMVVSEGVGVRKPDPAIFEIAARTAGASLEGAWMIGDSAAADIRGAVNAGLSSVWLSRGRSLVAGDPRPTAIAASFPEAVTAVIGGA